MNIQTAIDILEIDLIKIVDKPYLKRQYHKMALKYHPDKNENKQEANEKFQQINEAYFYLSNLNENDVDKSYTTKEDVSYTNMLNVFIKTLLQSNTTNFESICSIIKEIVNNCQMISIKLFEGLDKHTAIEIYEFICNHKSVLHVSSETIESVKKIITDKFKNDQIYILNPSIDDLFENNVYKLVVGDNTYFVPLWHNELYFGDEKSNEGEIIVKCVPELPENISIDENNNLLVHFDINFTKEILNTPTMEIHIGKKTLILQVDALCIKKSQIIMFKYQGVSKIIDNDIYNVSKKSDVILYCNFV